MYDTLKKGWAMQYIFIILAFIFLLMSCGHDDKPKTDADKFNDFVSDCEFEAYWHTKQMLRDPDSMKDVEKLDIPNKKNNSTRILITYRAKNGFGGYVKEEKLYECSNRDVKTLKLIY